MPYVGTSTATTNFNKTVQELIQKKLAEELRASLIQLPTGAITPASFAGPGSGGNGIFRFNRYADLDDTPASHLLTEGEPPAGQALSIGYEEFNAVQRGDFVRLTDLSTFESPHALAAVAGERVKRQMAGIIDKRAAELWLAGTNVIYAGSKTATVDLVAADVMTSALVKRAAALLEGNDVPRFGGMGKGAAYVGLIHPFAKFDLESETADGGWIDASRYAGSTQLFAGELGTLGGVRFVSSTNCGVKALGGTNTTVALATSAAADDIIDTATAHGFAAGDPIRFKTLTGGTGVTAGQVYYVIAANLAAQTFQFSATVGGAAVNFTTDITAGTVGKAINVYSTTILGPKSIAWGDAGTQEVIVEKGGVSDPLHQIMTVGWKCYLDGCLVGEGDTSVNFVGPRYVRVESASSI